jgi:hypothetical protein
MLSSHGHFTQHRPPRAYQFLIRTPPAAIDAGSTAPLRQSRQTPTRPAFRFASQRGCVGHPRTLSHPDGIRGPLPPSASPAPHSPHHPARAASACVLKKKICLKKGRVTHHRFPPTHRDKVRRPCLPAPSTNSTGVATSSWARHARTATQPGEWPPYAIP